MTNMIHDTNIDIAHNVNLLIHHISAWQVTSITQQYSCNHCAFCTPVPPPRRLPPSEGGTGVARYCCVSC